MPNEPCPNCNYNSDKRAEAEAALAVVQAELAQSKEQVAEMQQRLDAPPSHVLGLCDDPACGSCVQAAQEYEKIGRTSMLKDFDHAFTWANRPDIASIVVELAQEWERAGKPKPEVVSAEVQ